ncbi:MAG TPA: hypothetical protein VMP01_22435 [Pirellulaceae bacterium]|nr:hypothetical protein [Pirellulaceae bacterium]
MENSHADHRTLARTTGQVACTAGCDRPDATLLADIYGSMSEGFDTADLQDAQTLLVQVSGSAN